MPDPRTVLAEIQARADAATAGPWKLWGGSVQTDRSGTGETNYAEMIAHTRDPDRWDTSNATFIAKSRDDVPRLVAALTAVLDLCEEWDTRTAGEIRSAVTAALTSEAANA